MQEAPYYLSEDGKIGTIIASKNFFEEAAVITTFGKYTSTYFITIQPAYDTDVKITVECKKSASLSLELLKNMVNELIDQQIRVDLESRFGDLRKIIVKRAFEPVQL